MIKRGCNSTSEQPQGVFGGVIRAGVITVEPLLPHTCGGVVCLQEHLQLPRILDVGTYLPVIPSSKTKGRNLDDETPQHMTSQMTQPPQRRRQFQTQYRL